MENGTDVEMEGDAEQISSTSSEVKAVNAARKAHACNICAESFTQSHTLKLNIRSTLLGEKITCGQWTL